MYFICPGDSTKIEISNCDGHTETGAVFSVNYTAINLHCNCTIIPRYQNGALVFASNAIRDNCYTETTAGGTEKLNHNTM